MEEIRGIGRICGGIGGHAESMGAIRMAGRIHGSNVAEACGIHRSDGGGGCRQLL